jgi:transcriptional regulator with XRE-family HTH domain
MTNLEFTTLRSNTLNLSQLQLAEILDVSPSTISKYESGELCIPKSVKLSLLFLVEKAIQNKEKEIITNLPEIADEGYLIVLNNLISKQNKLRRIELEIKAEMINKLLFLSLLKNFILFSLESKKFKNIKEVSSFLKVGEETLYRWIRQLDGKRLEEIGKDKESIKKNKILKTFFFTTPPYQKMVEIMKRMFEVSFKKEVKKEEEKEIKEDFKEVKEIKEISSSDLLLDIPENPVSLSFLEDVKKEDQKEITRLKNELLSKIEHKNDDWEDILKNED